MIRDASTDSGIDRATSVLLRGGHVLTMDSEARVLPASDVLIDQDSIAEIGANLEASQTTQVIDASDCWVMPGIIQGHVHLGQTFFRGLAEGRRLLPWLRESSKPRTTTRLPIGARL
jgi:5-methylthioadenosine/S-adenosylhomocysteine deaminase